MLQFLKIFLPTYIFCFIIDMLWLGFLAKKIYHEEIGLLIRKSGESMAPCWPAALLVYVAIVTGIIVFVLPKASFNHHYLGLNIIPYGVIFGLVLYGTYDLTNYAVLANWSLKITIIDICWGTFLCSITSLFAFYAQYFISPK